MLTNDDNLLSIKLTKMNYCLFLTMSVNRCVFNIERLKNENFELRVKSYFPKSQR